jgi:Rrf2 family protein
MQLPVKSHYAVVAMLALAEKYHGGQLVSAKQIATDQGIPSQFLTQIMQQLRAAGLVTSVRGANGGFQLCSSPEETSVGDVVQAVCPASARESVCTKSSFSCTVDRIFVDLQTAQMETIAAISLAEVLQQSQENPAEVMFYI